MAASVAIHPVEPDAGTGQSGPAGLLDFQRRRKASSRERLLAAAAEAFCARGYFAVSIEEISSAAGVSRMTFYRHFSGKAAITVELFRANAETSMPRVLAIGERDYRDRTVVLDWIGQLFERNHAQRKLLRVFVEANVEGSGFTEKAQQFLEEVIARLGDTIPAFALDPANPPERRRWMEAWLLFYELFDQSNHAARRSGVATDPLIVEILADRFLGFVAAGEGAAATR